MKTAVSIWLRQLASAFILDGVPGACREACRWRHNRRLFASPRELARQRRQIFADSPRFAVELAWRTVAPDALARTLDSLLAQTHANWEAHVARPTDAAAAAVAQDYARRDARIRGADGTAAETTADYVARLDAGDLLAPEAFFELAVVCRAARPDVLFTDEAEFTGCPARIGRIRFKRNYAPDELRAGDGIGQLLVARRDLWNRPGIAGANGHDLRLRLCEQARRIDHVPRPLFFQNADFAAAPAADAAAVQAHLERVGLAGRAEPLSDAPFCRIRYALRGNPTISLVIPNRDSQPLLETCIASIQRRSTYPNFEIVVVENGSTAPGLAACYARLVRDSRIRVVEYPRGRPFNFSALCNFGARQTGGEHLLFLNNDVEVLAPNWLEEMLAFSQRPDVGACGALLLQPDGTIQHAGILLDGLPRHRGRGRVPHDDGAFRHPHELAAVTFACCLTRRAVFEQVGGLDEDFPVAYNDVDYCLKVRRAGLRIVWTPHAELRHRESATRGRDLTPAKFLRSVAEARRLRRKWPAELNGTDPGANPHLSGHPAAI